jgi:hypothetical protein
MNKKRKKKWIKIEGKTLLKDRKIRKFEIPCLLVSVIEPHVKENIIEIIVSSND